MTCGQGRHDIAFGVDQLVVLRLEEAGHLPRGPEVGRAVHARP